MTASGPANCSSKERYRLFPPWPKWLPRPLTPSLLVLSILFASLSQAKTLVLFEQGRAVRKLDRLLWQVEDGDTLVFSNERQFKVKGVLGTGLTTVIFALEDGRALRVRKHRRDILGHQGGTLNTYARGYEDLSTEGLPVPKLYLEESNPSEFLVVERIGPQHHITMEDWLRYLSRMPPETDLKYQSLLTLARSTARFSEIADFKAANIVWNGYQWIIADWTARHKRAYTQMDGTAFDVFFLKLPDPNLAKNLQERLQTAIIERRRELGFSPNLPCELILRSSTSAESQNINWGGSPMDDDFEDFEF